MGEKITQIKLDEIALMRTILTLLIVCLHAFTCFQGGWAKPEGYVDIPLYKWIARTAFAFTLESFVFISGYLLAFQQITLKKHRDLRIVKSKFKRLLIPSVIFSILYFFVFYQYDGFGHFLYDILNGCGHMWYLPMLFWCFIGVILLNKCRINDVYILLFMAFLNICWPISLPLQLSRSFYYIFYFYLGYVIYKNSEYVKQKISLKYLIISILIFLLCFVLFRPLQETIVIGDQGVKYYRLLTSIVQNLCNFIYAVTGTISFYLVVVWHTNRKSLKSIVLNFASCCFGVYIIHQFVLKVLYYNTAFASIVGPYFLPWLGFLITLLISYYITKLLVQTRIGRFLLG